MNRLFNKAQWNKSNNSTLIEIRLILMKILMIEAYNFILYIVQIIIYILYTLFSQILKIK